MKNKPTLHVSTSQTSEKKVSDWIRPGAKALIVHEGKILVISEKLADGGIIHDFPGGGIEYGETAPDALIREVKEEIGIDVLVGKPVGSWTFVLEKWNVQILCIGYQCSVIGSVDLDFSKNPAQENIFQAKWHTKEELLQGDILRAPGMEAAVALV